MWRATPFYRWQKKGIESNVPKAGSCSGVVRSDSNPHASPSCYIASLSENVRVKMGVLPGSFSFYILWYYNRAKYLLNKQFERASLRGDVHFQKHVSFKTQMEYYLLCPLSARHSIASVRWSLPSVPTSALITPRAPSPACPSYLFGCWLFWIKTAQCTYMFLSLCEPIDIRSFILEEHEGISRNLKWSAGSDTMCLRKNQKSEACLLHLRNQRLRFQ